jgi:hypothetical protein
MNEDFIFRVGADVSGFTKSITQVEAELKKLQTELKTKTGAAIVETNKYIADLQSTLTNLRTQGLSKLPQAVNQGASSLNALGQVARDAPFGFIAIQNNLPILFDQLSLLSQRSGGAVSALKSIGASLIGPAGVTFAIGAAISVITVLVQKYGSVGAALDALITKQSKYSEEILEANKSYEKFNKEKRDSIEISSQEVASIQGSIAKVSALASIVTDLTKSYNERNTALNDLKSIDKERFGNLDIEKTKLEDLTTAVDNYIVSIKQAAITKGFEGAIGETSVELAKQVKLLNTLKGDLDLARKKPLKFIGKEDRIDTSEIDVANKAFVAQEVIVNALRGDIALYNTEIDKSVKAQNTLQAPIDAANKAFAEQQKTIANNKKLLAERKAQAAENARILEKERTDALRIVEERIKRQDFLNKEDNKNLERAIKERRKLEREAGINVPTTLPIAPPAIPINQGNIDAAAKVASGALASIKEDADLSAALSLAEGTFFNPISDLFENFLTTGKFAFKDFGKAVLQAISQIVAKVIATGIISLLFTIFSGGFGAGAGGAAGGFKAVVKGITSALGFGGAKSVAAPSFAGVSGGGMEMGGAVNLVLRGSDLVGSINRTNSTINKVG